MTGLNLAELNKNLVSISKKFYLIYNSNYISLAYNGLVVLIFIVCQNNDLSYDDLQFKILDMASRIQKEHNNYKALTSFSYDKSFVPDTDHVGVAVYKHKLVVYGGFKVYCNNLVEYNKILNILNKNKKTVINSLQASEYDGLDLAEISSTFNGEKITLKFKPNYSLCGNKLASSNSELNITL